MRQDEQDVFEPRLMDSLKWMASPEGKKQTHLFFPIRGFPAVSMKNH